MKTLKVNIGDVHLNKDNPRVIKDEKFKKLVKSIQDFPQMIEIRPIVVNDEMIVLGGNMRLRALQEAGYKKIPVIKVSDLTEEQQKEFIIKDNVAYGEWDWDILANEFDAATLTDFGLDVPSFDEKPIKESDDLSDEIESMYRIEVVCKDEKEQELTYNKLIEMNYVCRILTS